VRAKSVKGTARLQQTVAIGKGGKTRLLRGDVASLEAEAGVSPLLLGSTGNGPEGARVLLFQDVTKLLHLEEKLKQNEKLAAVGQLAAGIAHEIRNPLASMSASIEMLKDSFPEASVKGENRRLMEIAIREIDRLNLLITEFLDFVKPEKLKLVDVDLPGLLGDVVLAVRGSKDAKDRVTFHEEFTASAARGSAEKLKQVVYNLVVNAVQAMGKGGEVRVGCASVNAQRVKFWVQDQGHGMSEDVLAHLYEPFFTTKDKGTGLGLATAYKIIEAHHGEIRVTSKPGAGTRFEIWLPSA
jgi:two-component system, NtrC family, sensor histidine kinase PilS